MRFDYTTILSAAPDTGDPIVIFRPEIDLIVHGPNGSADFLALVDSGADNTIFPELVARTLGIQPIVAKGPAAKAFGGQEMALSYADVKLELVHPERSLRWLARVYFVVEEQEDQALVLGHQGFLDYFTATFVGEECVLDLEPNSYLPAAENSK
jgi:hypothetical protein